MKNKLIFAILYILLLSIGVFTVYKNIPFGHVAFTNAYLANIAQRVLGLTIFSMLFVQICLGFFIKKLTEKFGGWIYTFHMFEGITIYALVIGHISSFILFNYFTGHGFDPFYAFVDICVLCDPAREYYLTFGRLAFWFMTTIVATALLRTQTPFLRLHWKKFHYFNYLVFLFGAVHSIGLGTDIGTSPYSYFYGSAIVFIAGLGIYRLYHFFKNFKWN